MPKNHLANRLVGNPEGEAGLEVTAVGPRLKFLQDCVIAIAGARFQPSLDGEAFPMWESTRVKKDTTLSFGKIEEHGFRAYLCIAGGIDVPLFLGSRSTFPHGHLGGFEGRPLMNGDVLKIGKHDLPWRDLIGKVVKHSARPIHMRLWEIGVTPGPHADPDFLTADDMHMFFSQEWQVHYNSNRLGCRLVGPKPRWARLEGGQAGRHPSNIHDCAYALGTVNMTGDMPVILSVDGPSMGGFRIQRHSCEC